MISGPGRGPLVKYPYELSPRKVGPRKILRDISESEAVQCRVSNLKDIVEVSCPSTRTFNSRPFRSNSQAHNPPCVGRRKLMHDVR